MIVSGFELPQLDINPPGGAGLTPIATARFLGNVSGVDALPYAVRFEPPVAGMTIGTAGDAFVFAFDDDLLAVEDINTFGLATRTAANTWTTRAVVGTANRITITNGSGVAGNPTVNVSADYVNETDFQVALFWGVFENAAASDMGSLSDSVFLTAVDFGILTGVGNIPTAGFTAMDLGTF